MERKHPSHGDLYTPYTPELQELFVRMKLEYGTYRRICAISGTRLKVFRAIRNGNRKAISMRMLDRLITTTGVGTLDDYLWFTADDLVALGIWKPVEWDKTKPRKKKGPTARQKERQERRERLRRIRKVQQGKMPWE